MLNSAGYTVTHSLMHWPCFPLVYSAVFPALPLLLHSFHQILFFTADQSAEHETQQSMYLAPFVKIKSDLP